MTLFSDKATSQFSPRSDAETCQFCARNDGVWISDPKGYFEICGDSPTTILRNGSGAVAFHCCAKCGDLAFATYPEKPEGKLFAVMRLRLFPEIARGAQAVRMTNFSDEDSESARARRLQNWTPVIEDV